MRSTMIREQAKIFQESMADWEGLPHDLVALIPKRIELVEDFMAFRMVCKLWKEAALSTRQFLRDGKLQVPWLLLPTVVEDLNERRRGRCEVYSLPKEQIVSNIPALEMPADTMCVGLNYGWVLMISLSGDMTLVNPLSRESRIELPRQDPSYRIVEFDCESSSSYVRAAMSRDPSELSSDFVIVIASPKCCGFWRQNDKHWTCQKSIPLSKNFDLVYYENHFYVIRVVSIGFAIYTMHIPKTGPPLPVSILLFTPIRDVIGRPYAVGSTGHALLVLGLKKEKGRGVVSFEVYEVDLNTGGSKLLSSLGDRTIFLGSHNTSTAFNQVLKSFSGSIKPNHIYFIDDGGDKEMGSYCLEDRQIKKFNIGRPVDWRSPPFWFTPCL